MMQEARSRSKHWRSSQCSCAAGLQAVLQIWAVKKCRNESETTTELTCAQALKLPKAQARPCESGSMKEAARTGALACACVVYWGA
eukprot:1160421-Pelagomonas_calceolata.AAC.2